MDKDDFFDFLGILGRRLDRKPREEMKVSKMAYEHWYDKNDQKVVGTDKSNKKEVDK